MGGSFGQRALVQGSLIFLEEFPSAFPFWKRGHPGQVSSVLISESDENTGFASSLRLPLQMVWISWGPSTPLSLQLEIENKKESHSPFPPHTRILPLTCGLWKPRGNVTGRRVRTIQIQPSADQQEHFSCVKPRMSSSAWTPC